MTIVSPQLSSCRMNTGPLSTFLATDYIDLLLYELSFNDPGPQEGPPSAICVGNTWNMLASLFAFWERDSARENGLEGRYFLFFF